jgi:hypothetical protein
MPGRRPPLPSIRAVIGSRALEDRSMSMRWIVIALVVGIGVLAFVAWRGSTKPAQQAAMPPQQEASGEPGGAMPPGGGMGDVSAPADPGIAWNVPGGWTDQGPRSMRLATYSVPAKNGGEAAECAVFYFGPGQGGGTEANLERWIGEFENPAPPERSSRDVHGGSMGGMPQPTAPNGELLGAIVEGPAGSVFFKLTGPAATVDAAVADFDRMIGSVNKK